MARLLLSALIGALLAIGSHASNVCVSNTCAPANLISDFVFLVDKSNSMDKLQFDKVRDLLRSFAGTLTIGAQGSRMAIYSFGVAPDIVGTFDTLSSLDAINTAIDGMKYEGEVERNLYSAFTVQAANDMTNTRPEAEKLLVIVLGDAWSGSDVFASAALQQSRLVYDAIMVIGVNPQPIDNALEEIRRLAVDDRNIYFAFDLDAQLPYASLWLAENACPGSHMVPTTAAPTTIPTPNPSAGCDLQNLALDVFLVVDNSASLSDDEYAQLKSAIYDFVVPFPLGEGQTRFGLTTVFSDVQMYATGLDSAVMNRADLLRTIESLPKETTSGQALNLALMGIEARYLKKGSSAKNKLLVYFTADTNWDEDPAAQMTKLVDTYGVHVETVQWLTSASSSDLERIAGNFRCVVSGASVSLRKDVVKNLQTAVCSNSYCR